MIKVGKATATVEEQFVELNGSANATLILATDDNCEISINDNEHYQEYKNGEVIPLMDRSSTFQRLFYKTVSGSAEIRYWLMG